MKERETCRIYVFACMPVCFRAIHFVMYMEQVRARARKREWLVRWQSYEMSCVNFGYSGESKMSMVSNVTQFLPLLLLLVCVCTSKL